MLVVIVVLIGYTLIEYQREKLTEQVLMRGGVLARNLSVIVLENYTTRDLIPAASYARSLLKEEGVIEAFFITKKGYVLAHSDGEKATMDPEDPKIKWTHYGRSIKPSEEYNKPFFLKGEELKEGEYTYQLYKNKYYDIYSPVISEKALQMRGKEIVKRKYFGDAHIIFSREIIFKAVRQARQRTIYIALGAIALGVLGALALATSIVRPIKKLAQGTAKIGSGELGYKIAIRSKDEIGALASDFNEMTGKLKEAQKVMLDKKRTEREMEIAAEIQNTLLPKSIPKFSNLELAAFYQPAKTVGGDYYDMIPLTNTKIAIVVADVSGKGVPGSLGMTMFRSILRSIIRPDVSAYDTLCRVNELIKPDIPESMFMTAFYGIFDTVTKKFDYAIAGHDPLIVYNSTT
ncbi:MAG: SpoIIE family protein phosphatase, partial [Spirochaetes bacterium]|nr:SpoIIE family protein phosphatase [Spirochaetota bacterium]